MDSNELKEAKEIMQSKTDELLLDINHLHDAILALKVDIANAPDMTSIETAAKHFEKNCLDGLKYIEVFG